MMDMLRRIFVVVGPGEIRQFPRGAKISTGPRISTDSHTLELRAYPGRFLFIPGLKQSSRRCTARYPDTQQVESDPA
jgi:hypothetical protein